MFIKSRRSTDGALIREWTIIPLSSLSADSISDGEECGVTLSTISNNAVYPFPSNLRVAVRNASMSALSFSIVP